MRTSLANFNILIPQSQSGTCHQFEFMNIRGTNVLTARHHSGMKKMKVLCTQIATKISVNSTERLVQFYNEDNFGGYGAVNPLHRCSSGPNATTQVWLGGQWNDASSFIFSCTRRRDMFRIINSSWLQQNEDATLYIMCDNYNHPQHSFLSTYLISISDKWILTNVVNN